VMGAQALTSLVEGLNEQRRVLSRVLHVPVQIGFRPARA
jgi:hypothetical protein